MFDTERADSREALDTKLVYKEASGETGVKNIRSKRKRDREVERGGRRAEGKRKAGRQRERTGGRRGCRRRGPRERIPPGATPVLSAIRISVFSSVYNATEYNRSSR